MLDMYNGSSLQISQVNDSQSNNIFNLVNITLFNWMVFATLVQIFALFGIISNIVNIVCFAKQGFDDSINVSLSATMLDESKESSLQILELNDSPPNKILNLVNITLFNWIVFATLVQIFAIFGIISNIINIVCFVKQGFKDSINVSLTGLAVSDLGCLLPLIWMDICYTPTFYEQDLLYEVNEIQYMTSGITYVMLTRISSWITAVITLERCLCVAMPLKVKEIATPKRTFIIIVSTFAVLIAGLSPQYYYYRAGSKFVPSRNKTLIGIIYTTELMNFENISYPINIVFIPFLSYCIIIIATSILVIELKLKAKWRETAAVSANKANLSSSNMKIAKVVVMIAVLFIASYVPVMVNITAMNVVPGFTINERFEQIATVIGGLGVLLESINASTNIFIYYYMSTKYRDAFNEIFFRMNARSVRDSREKCR